VLGEAVTDRTIQFTQSIAAIATAARATSANDALSLGIAASIYTYAPVSNGDWSRSAGAQAAHAPGRGRVD